MSLDSLSFAYMSPSPFISVITVNGTLMPLTGVDFIVTPHLSLLNIYIILKLTLNLASIGQLCNFSDYLEV